MFELCRDEQSEQKEERRHREPSSTLNVIFWRFHGGLNTFKQLRPVSWGAPSETYLQKNETNWTSADTPVWNIFGCWLFVYLLLLEELDTSLSSFWPRLHPLFFLSCPWDVCFVWTFWTHLVLNAVKPECRTAAGVCDFLNLVSIYIFIHVRSGWRRGGEAGIKHLWVTLSIFTAEAKQTSSWSKFIFRWS